MRIATRLAILATFVLAFGAAPATAQEAPAVCQGRNIPLATDANGNPIEKLVEHHLYFHGQSTAGNADAAQEFVEIIVLGGTPRLTMDGTAPTGSGDKVFVHNTLGVGVQWNPNFFMSPGLAHWYRELSGDQRIVCAEATAYASTSTGTLNIQLWADKAVGDPDPVETKPATGGTANQVSKYTGNFGEIDFVASMNLLVQLVGPSNNATVNYDSTASPGGLTYVTVEPI